MVVWLILILVLSTILWILQRRVSWSQTCLFNLIRGGMYIFYTAGFAVAIVAIPTRAVLYYLQYKSIYNKELGNSIE